MSGLRVTIDEVMSWKPCGWDGEDDGKNYTLKRVKHLFNGRESMTALDILALDIPAKDRLWLVLREELIYTQTLRLFACDCAERDLLRERASGREPDKASWPTIEVARRYARNKATEEELAAAFNDAWTAALDAARAKEWAAAALGDDWTALLDATRPCNWSVARETVWVAIALPSTQDAVMNVVMNAVMDAVKQAIRHAKQEDPQGYLVPPGVSAWKASARAVHRRIAARVKTVENAEREWQIKHLKEMLRAA